MDRTGKQTGKRQHFSVEWMKLPSRADGQFWFASLKVLVPAKFTQLGAIAEAAATAHWHKMAQRPLNFNLPDPRLS